MATRLDHGLGPANHIVVSVLLPARNAASTLDATLASVLRAPFSELEVVAIDDASTDNTLDIFRRWSARDGRLTLLRGAGTGIVDALNLGLTHCRGAYVARMDADDISHPQRFALQAAALDSDASLAGVGGLVRLFPRGALKSGMLTYEAWLNTVVTAEEVARARFIESPLVHPS